MDKTLSSTNLLNKFKKIFVYGEHVRPVRDWYVLLAVAAILLVLGIGWNVFLFNELENGKSLGQAIVPPHEVVGNSVTSVQTIFQQRATEENNYQNTYHFVDPSLPGS